MKVRVIDAIVLLVAWTFPEIDDETKLKLVIDPIKIGKGAFVGAGTIIAPGVDVEAGALVRAGTQLFPGDKVARK